VSTRKRTTKPEAADVAAQEPSAEVPEQPVERTEEVAAVEPESAPVEVPQVVETTLTVGPTLRRCPSHPRLFPSESAMRPMPEFRFRADGKLSQTYCKRCQTQLAKERRRAKQQEAATEQANSDLAVFNIKEVVAEVRGLIASGAAPVESVDLIVGSIEESLQALRLELEERFDLEPGSSDHATDDMHEHLVEEQLSAPKAADDE
jgi:hypothetical protein